MFDNPQHYEPSDSFTNVNTLFGNHFRFVIDALPDLTFYAQSIQLPSVVVASVKRHNPFVAINEVGDHLTYGTFDVAYLVDAQFKNYMSLYWWIKGYGFPHSPDEVAQFREERKKRLPNPRPMVRELEKTNAVLYINQPDTEQAIAEIMFEDVVPTALGEMTFETTDSDAPALKCRVTFACTDFDVVLK